MERHAWTVDRNVLQETATPPLWQWFRPRQDAQNHRCKRHDDSPRASSRFQDVAGHHWKTFRHSHSIINKVSETRVVKGIGCDQHRALPSLLP